MARIVSLAVVTLLIVILGITFFQVVAPFLLPLFLAAVIAMLLQPVQNFFERKTHGRTRVSAGLTTGSVVLGFSVPMILGVVLGIFQIQTFVNNALEYEAESSFVQTIRAELDIAKIVSRLQPFFAETIDAGKLQEDLKKSVNAGLEFLAPKTLGAAGFAVGFVGSLVATTVSLLIFVIALYYFLADGPSLLASAEGLIPVGAAYQRELWVRFNSVVRAVVMATFLAAVGQGFANAVMLWCFGFRQFVILFVLGTIASLVPLVGTWLVWGPCVIWLASEGSWIAAIFLTLIGAGVIGMLDNVIRTYVLHSDAQLHPLLAFVSVLGGVQVMGLWGVFIAPIVAAILHALIVIFNTELKELSQERSALPQLPPDLGPPVEDVTPPTPPTEAPASGPATNSPPARESTPNETPANE